MGISAGKVSVLSREQLVKKGLSKGIADAIVNTTLKYESPLGLSGYIGNTICDADFNEESDTLLYTGQMYLLASYSKLLSRMEGSMGDKASEFAGKLISTFPVMMRLISIILPNRDKKYYVDNIRNICSVLTREGVKFKVMIKEPYPGTFLFDLGYLDEFKRYAATIKSRFESLGIRRIITVDPHTYNLLKYEYPKYLADFNFEVVFYTDLIKCESLRNTGEQVIFHEPCHLTRGNEILNSPLNLLRSSRDVLLPSKSGAMTACCGGPDELLFPSISEKVSVNRYKELQSLGNHDIVTACPICLSNLGRVGKVTDLSSILKASQR
ncbi:MAG: (Fe-S)-binding protein [Thermoplasmatales archaeon]